MLLGKIGAGGKGDKDMWKTIELDGKIYIISDVHLEKDDVRKNILSQFISSLDGNLIFLGDIFDIWIGRSEENKQIFSSILEAIEELLRRGMNIFYIEGNHDFHLIWLDDMGIERAREMIIKTGKKEFFLSHGDMYSGEITHTLYRKFILKTEGIFRFASNGYFEKTVNTIGELFSSLSHKKNLLPHFKGKREKLFYNMLKNGVEISRKLGVDGVIFGHCHIPVVLNIDEKIYANTGFWGYKYGTYIELINGDVKIKRIDFSV